MKPVVDRLEKDLQDRSVVIRLDVGTQLGREMAWAHRLSAVPAFLLFDKEGAILHREVGWIDADRVRELVELETSLPEEQTQGG